LDQDLTLKVCYEYLININYPFIVEGVFSGGAIGAVNVRLAAYSG
jgi:hypothetical protein